MNDNLVEILSAISVITVNGEVIYSCEEGDLNE